MFRITGVILSMPYSCSYILLSTSPQLADFKVYNTLPLINYWIIGGLCLGIEGHTAAKLNFQPVAANDSLLFVRFE